MNNIKKKIIQFIIGVGMLIVTASSVTDELGINPIAFDPVPPIAIIMLVIFIKSPQEYP